jgi:hypothetical protein
MPTLREVVSHRGGHTPHCLCTQHERKTISSERAWRLAHHLATTLARGLATQWPRDEGGHDKPSGRQQRA